MGAQKTGQNNPALSSAPTPTTIPGTRVTSRWVWVTPELAREFLESNTANRNSRAKHVAKLVTDMNADRYKLNHQGIAFDEDGVLMDGQHRLMGIVQSGKPQWLLVTRGLSPTAKGTIDTMSRRHAADFQDNPNKKIYASAVKAMLALESLDFDFNVQTFRYALQKVTDAQMIEAWEKWGNLDDIVALGNKASKNISGCGPQSMICAALVFPETAEEFLNGLIEMDGLEKEDPRLALLKYNVSRNGGRNSYSQSGPAMFLALKCAKAYAEGRKLKLLRGSNTEDIKCYPVKRVQEEIPSEDAQPNGNSNAA